MAKEISLGMDVTGTKHIQNIVGPMTLKPSKPKVCAVHALEVQMDPATTQTKV